MATPTSSRLRCPARLPGCRCGSRRLFYWSVGNSQISDGVSVGDYAVLVAVGLCALTAAMLAFRRLDIH